MKRFLTIICMAILVLLATSCYTHKPCPAYGHYSENYPEQSTLVYEN